MYLKSICLENFRNHNLTKIECSKGINFILGKNGEGKTNILEGISILCLYKSFFNANDLTVLKSGMQKYRVTGETISDGGIEYNIIVDYDKETNTKKATVNRIKIEKATELFGQFPVVILSPEQGAITLGSPIDRRRFIDFVIAQSSKIYLDNLINYRRVLKQRNKILTEIALKNVKNYDEIDSWNESLINIGTLIIKKRIEFIKEIQDIVVYTYSKISGLNEIPELLYEPSFAIEDENIDTKSKFREELLKKQKVEHRFGFTLIGPHRDEIVFKINKYNARNFASQGQHKTLLVSLKLAEFKYLKEKCNETPIILLDDMLSELDVERCQRLIEIISEFGQSFITSTDERALSWFPMSTALPKKFYVKQGNVERIENAVHKN